MPEKRPTGALAAWDRRVSRRQSATRLRRVPIAGDARLSARFRDGDPDAVRAAYSAYGRLVYGVAYGVLADRSLSEEATQQTFLNAWRSAERVDPGRDLGPWLATIARRASIDIYRREARRAAKPLEDVPADNPALTSPTFALDDAYDVWEVRRAVSLLPGDEQQIVRAQHFEGLTHQQIAARFGIPVGTVKSRSHRAHQRLASSLWHLRQREVTYRCA
ncbi:MAG: sigma-70 family RNA polymerase sigma factor [Solirubrobacterales bacterium]|nr:sigma-70 family RNA polymerase sigma factor [Solirubrobacterales bacterium]